MSGVRMLGPLEENTATFGAGLVLEIVIVGDILATGFLQ